MKKSLIKFFFISFLCSLFLVISCKTEVQTVSAEFFIVFDACNGTAPVKKVIAKNDFVDKPEDPIKDGWHFAGWYTSDGKLFDFDLPIVTSHKIKAKWEAIVNFYDNRTDVPTVKYVAENEIPSYPKIDGYVIDGISYGFVYWSTNKNATVESIDTDKYDLSKGVTTSPVNLYAIYGEKTQTDYLMIMYIDGDNDLNDYLYQDMNEVEYGLEQIRNSDGTAKSGYASVTVVALWDGWTGDNETSPNYGSKNTHIYEIGTDTGISLNTNGSVLSENTKDLTSEAEWIKNGEVNMGDKQTLINFLNWVNKHYQAKNVILQFSNHGAGPRSMPIYIKTEDGHSVKIDNSGRRGLCWDESSKTFLQTKDVSDALIAAGYGKENQLDMILMDVCLGASVEDAYQFKDYAKYMVASPNNIEVAGMDYVSMMKSFRSDSTIKSVGEELIDDFRTYYQWTDAQWSEVAASLNVDKTKVHWYSNAVISTLSMIDLSKIDAVEDSITVLAKLLVDNKDKLYTGYYYDANDNIVKTKTEKPVRYSDMLIKYAKISVGDSLYYQGSYSWLIDIGYMMDNFGFQAGDQMYGFNNPDAVEWKELVSACRNVRAAVKSAIVKSWRDYPGSSLNGYDHNLYTYLEGTHFGLTICAESLVINNGMIVSGVCPSFYRTDLAFGKDSAWADLLETWFGK